MRVARLTALVLALTLAAPAHADLKAGLAAYDAEYWETALRELLPEAEAGNAEAQYRVGRMYRRGLSVPVDVDLALKWYGAGARNGSNKAMYGLALMYDVGEQVPKDLARAECWYRLSAERGHSPSQFVLGDLVHKRFQWTESEYWWNRAMAQGDAYAFYNEGRAQLWNPLREDKTEAYKMLLLAADRGMQSAIEVVARIRALGLSEIRQRQFDEARRLADAWAAVPEPQIATPPDDIPQACLDAAS